MSGNSKNLKRLSSDEARRYGAAGGRKSAEVRRKKKELRQLTKSFLLSDAIIPARKNLEKLGFSMDDMTNLAVILGTLFVKILNDADLKAAITLVEWAGLTPGQNVKELLQQTEKLRMILEPPAEDEKQDAQVVFYKVEK